LMSDQSGYVYLNLANQWPLFSLSAIDINAQGALCLSSSGTAYASRGVFCAGPFTSPALGVPWFRLKIIADPLPAGTHVQIFTYAGSAAPSYDLSSPTPFSDPAWLGAPRDALDQLILNENANQLWIGGILRTETSATPTLHQMRLEYGRNTYATFLPMLYRGNGAQSDLLERFMALHQSVLGGIEDEIAGMPRLFDPLAAPDPSPPSWLEWLSSWLTFALDGNWSEPQKRQYLMSAFRLFQRRGTVEGLLEYLRIYAGVKAHIQEPGLHTTMWSLGTVSNLGFSTMLAPGPAQGAVVGTSATLDQSHLTEDVDLGAALYDDIAHEFCIQVYCAELNRPGAMAALQAVIAQEKPAHTECHVCGIDARMRVGVQTRVGIDTIVAAGPPIAGLGTPLGTGALGDVSLSCYP
jgi:phage tail-like protein